ncbi:hypothetical protein GCM10028833_17830 [Glycomyces tarimensis]
MALLEQRAAVGGGLSGRRHAPTLRKQMHSVQLNRGVVPNALTEAIGEPGRSRGRAPHPVAFVAVKAVR